MPALSSGQKLFSKKETAKATKRSKKAKKKAKKNMEEAQKQIEIAQKYMEIAIEQKEVALCFCGPHYDLYLQEHYSYLQSKKELEKEQNRYEERKRSSDKPLENLAAQILVLEETLVEKKIALKKRGLSLAQRTAIRSIRTTDFNMKSALAKEAYSLYLTSDGSLMDAYIYKAIYSILHRLEETNNDNPNFNTLDQLPEGRTRLGRIRNMIVGKGNANFYTNGSDGLLLKWKFNSDSTLFKDKSNKPKMLSKSIYAVRALDISPNGKQLARAGDGDKISITDTKSGQVIKELSSHRGGRIWSLKYMPDGKAIITAEEDGFGGTSINYTTLDDTSFSIIEKTPYRLNALNISNDGKYLAGVGKSSEVWVWNLKDQCHEFILSPPYHQKHARALAFSPQGRFIAVGYQNGLIIIWDMHKMNLDPNYLPIRLFQHKHSISDLEFNKNETMLLVGSLDKTATLWTIQNKKYEGENNDNEFPYLDPSYSPIELEHDEWVTAVAFSHDDTKAITGSANGKLKLWEIDLGVYFNKIQPFFKTLDTEDIYNVWYKYIGIDTRGVNLNEEELYLNYLNHSNKILSSLK
jgi:WD40 repeat protein